VRITGESQYQSTMGQYESRRDPVMVQDGVIAGNGIARIPDNRDCVGLTRMGQRAARQRWRGRSPTLGITISRLSPR